MCIRDRYEITVGDEAITLEEGEVVEIPMTLIENDESGIQPCLLYTSRCV